ncbi:MAG: MFS transporter [Nitrospiraceae bacterium]|nr:MFS transporter [Nitrospiraceae bacterium]
MGEFVWPFISIILQGNGLGESKIGLVLGFGNLLPLVFRVPLGYVLDRIESPSRFLILLFLLPLPLLLIAFTSVHDAFYGVILALMLWVGRLPYLPLSLALFNRKNSSPTTRKALNSFVLVQHFILGIVGLLAGTTLYFFGISSSIEAVGILTLILNIWIVSTHTQLPDRMTTKTKRTQILFPGKAETWMLLAFFSFHFVNAPLLPFTELFLRGITKNSSFIPLVSAIAELTMVIMSLIYSRWLSRLPVTKVILASFLAQPLRLFALSHAHSPWAILAIALLDGWGAGLFAMTSLIWARERARENQVFNQFVGYIDLAVVLGGVFGSFTAGAMISRWGFSGFAARDIWPSLLPPFFLFSYRFFARKEEKAL